MAAHAHKLGKPPERSAVSVKGQERALKRIQLTPLSKEIAIPERNVETSEDIVAAVARLSKVQPLQAPVEYGKGVFKFGIPSLKVEEQEDEEEPAISKPVKVVKQEQPVTKPDVKPKAMSKKQRRAAAKKQAKARVVKTKVKQQDLKVAAKAETIKPEVKSVAPTQVTHSRQLATVEARRENAPVTNPNQITNMGVEQLPLVEAEFSQRFPSYDGDGKFVKMSTIKVIRQREQSYLDWLEDNISEPRSTTLEPHESTVSQYTLVQTEVRDIVTIGGISIPLGMKRQNVLVPTSYGKSEVVCLNKARLSNKSRKTPAEELPWDMTTGVALELEPIEQEEHQKSNASERIRNRLAADAAARVAELAAERQAKAKRMAIAKVTPSCEQVSRSLSVFKSLKIWKPGQAPDVHQYVDDPPTAAAVDADVSLEEQIKRLEAITETESNFESPVDQVMQFQELFELEQEQQREIEAEETALTNALAMMEARSAPTSLGNAGDLRLPSFYEAQQARLDAWYTSKCSFQHMEEARYHSWFADRIDPVTMSLLELESPKLYLKSPIPEPVMEQEDLSQYGSFISKEEAEVDLVMQKQRERFAERERLAKENGSGVKDSGRVTESVVPINTLIDPKAKERNIVEEIMSSRVTDVETFTPLNTVVPQSAFKKILERFKVDEDLGLWLPQPT